MPQSDSPEFAALDIDRFVGDIISCADIDASEHSHETNGSGFWVYNLYSFVGASGTPDQYIAFKIFKEKPAQDVMEGLASNPQNPMQLLGPSETESLIRQTQAHLENRDKIGLSKEALFLQSAQILFNQFQSTIHRHEQREAQHFAEMREAADRRNELEMILFHEARENEKSRELGGKLADVASKFMMYYAAQENSK